MQDCDIWSIHEDSKDDDCPDQTLFADAKPDGCVHLECPDLVANGCDSEGESREKELPDIVLTHKDLYTIVFVVCICSTVVFRIFIECSEYL